MPLALIRASCLQEKLGLDSNLPPQKHGYVGVPPYPVSDMYRIWIHCGYAGDTYPSRIGVLGCIGPRNSRLDTYLCVIRPSSPTPWEYPPLPCRIRPPHACRCTRLRREGWGRSCWGRRLREMVAVRWEESRQPPLPTPRGRARGGLPARAPRSIRRASSPASSSCSTPLSAPSRIRPPARVGKELPARVEMELPVVASMLRAAGEGEAGGRPGKGGAGGRPGKGGRGDREREERMGERERETGRPREGEITDKVSFFILPLSFFNNYILVPKTSISSHSNPYNFYFLTF